MRRNGLAFVVLLCAAALFLASALLFLSSSAPTTVAHTDSLKRRQSERESENERRGIVTLILTAPTEESKAARDAMRRTWLSPSVSNFEHIFFVGGHGVDRLQLSALREEAEREKDVVVLEQTDEDYGGLTKKVLAALCWLARHRPHAQAVLKVDDDTYVRKAAFVSAFEAQLPRTRSVLYWGYFDGRARVRRTGKWAEPHWILSDTYIPYALGGGYLLGMDLVDYIAKNEKLFSIYNSEDVSIGTWLAPLNISRVHDTRFDTEWKTRGCLNKHLVLHKQTPEMMVALQASIDKIGVPCENEHRARKEYDYQWQLPPSQCCPGRGTN